MKAKIKIAIADDHGLMREGLSLMLQGVSDLEIVGVVGSGEEAVNLTSSVVPDVFLMDIVMRGMSGIEAARWIMDSNSSIKVILISSELNKEFISAGIKAGIYGYVPKNAEKETLLAAIQTVMKGERYFSPEVMSLVFDEFYGTESGTKPPSSKNKSGLTRRELEVIKLIGQGKKLRSIADQLFISVKTVETHKLNIQNKLNLSNTAQLVRYAIEHKLVSLGKGK